jgi:hypothetical protein
MKQPQKLLSRISFYITTFCLCLVFAFLLYSRITIDLHHKGKTSIMISESANTYTFEAYFNVNKTGKVQEYLNKCLAPNNLFGSKNDYFNANTLLADNTELHIKKSPGKLEINLDKKRNSYSSYYRIKNMCEGVKDLLGSK